MRLFNVVTRQLEEFFGDDIPQYAILSHTWEKDEVTYQDMQSGAFASRLGYAKIDGYCLKEIEQEIRYVWINTCCIDKSSSSELSKAINSMFSWYYRADVCFVYLADVPEEDILAPDSAFRRSTWFTSG